MALNICLAQRGCGFQNQAIVRLKARLAMRTAVLAVALEPTVLASYGVVKVGLRHAISAIRWSPWG